MRPINLLSSDISLSNAESELFGISGIHCVNVAIAMRAAVVVMAIVAVLDIVTVLTFVTSLIVVAVVAFVAIMTVVAIKTVVAIVRPTWLLLDLFGLEPGIKYKERVPG